MKKLFSAFAVLTAFALLTTSCKEDETTPAENIPVTEVKVTPSTASVVAGTTLEFKAQVLPENATDKTIKWEIQGDEKIATIDGKTGVVTGLTVGTVRVFAISSNKKSGYSTLTVTAAPIRVESVAIGEDFPLFVGKSKQLTATITPANATTQEVVWDSSNKAAATVDQTGKVVAVGDGKSTITATVDEKVGQCEVTVSTPDIADITMTTLDQGNTVTMTAAGFKAGDKVKLEALVAPETNTGEADVKDVTAENAKFDFPATLASDRSYKLTVMRGTEAKVEAFLRPDNQTARLPYALGYYMTGDGEVVENNPEMGSKARMGYVPGAIFEFDTETKEFIVWKKDAKLVGPLALKGIAGLGGGLGFDFSYTTGVTTLDPLKDLFDTSNVTTLLLSDMALTSLDMTIFPEATHLFMWGPMDGHGPLESINFGTYTDDAHACKLIHIQLERQSLTSLDLRNCIYPITSALDVSNNFITTINLGTANGTAGDKDRMLTMYKLIANNNKIKEIDISNCGRLRQLHLAGNKIERMRLLNNALGDGINSARPDEYFPYTYIIKSPDSFSVTWATAEDAEGRERVIDVERYWWRVFSSSNGTEAGGDLFEGGWLAGNPIVKALNDGFKVNCWAYWHEVSGQDPHLVEGHNHAGGSAPCTY